MEIATQVTAKHLDFIDDVDLRLALTQRLNELDRVFLVNAHYSTVFVAIGALEGIFKHVAARYKSEIEALKSYPKDHKGKKKKDFERLTIDDLYVLLRDLDIVPGIDEYPSLYKLFRGYRNCIHAQAQVRKGWEIDIGQAQMALGLLNATLRNLDRNVFVGKHVFEKIAGAPYYDSSRVLQLRVGESPHNSFVLLKEPITRAFSARFDADLSPKSLLNFVFDYVDEGNFQMLRLDRRPNSRYPNAVLRSTQKFVWSEVLLATPRKPPNKEMLPVEIEIDFDKQVFSLVVDGDPYTFSDLSGKQKNLFSRVHKGKRVGFFNEVAPVMLSNVVLDKLA
ncbi:MAG TPA: hypothetical protein VLM38_10965 [Blastocatellia bacterium]|nr:hypothetical protein [Blastocatellia bacterium]